ncbi:HD-GYP domain-containing protein [Halobacillus salinus]|uniref:HD-GYP domain-containing protein n=1 Tax=Halobacillus salinus TaxID=192814 RepID=A0A4Z0GVZ3_9BACI|nr:HD-GYP domain-containing protein [Halobacillus salinus]TGB01936.1 HD-GYP domain-containing protein [Halobacillus salinus]
MKPFQDFQKRILLNYVIGSMLAVFGVGSVFIFHTLTLKGNEATYLIFVMIISVVIMWIGELVAYRRHVQPIQRVFREQSVQKEEIRQAFLTAHRFPILTVQRIMGPHLFGLAVPASCFSLLGIYNGWVSLPYYYIALAWSGAVLIAVMHALIEFFLTFRSVNPLLAALIKRAEMLGFSIEETGTDYYLSIRRKLMVSSIFTAVFPVLLFILASQIRLAESGGSGIEGYWSWASLIVVVILAMGSVSSMLLYKSIEDPMITLREQFDQVGKGRFEKMDNVYSDEFSNLVTGFNHMITGIKERDEENERLLESFFTVFAATLDARDPYTAGHSERVAEYSVWIAERAGFEEGEVDLLRKSALLHDIGKIGVRDHVLLKAGRLTEEEFEQIKQHPVIGYEILQQVQLPEPLQPVLPGVRSHHERFDGKGYPDGLSGFDIPVFGRLMAVADAYDAMTSDRPYRKGMPQMKALSIIEEGRGTQWDPYFADLFLNEMRERNEQSERIAASIK